VLDDAGVPLAVLEHRLELLRDRGLDWVVVLLGSWNEDVHFRGLGGQNLGGEALLGEVELKTVGLVDGDSRGLAGDLDLARLGVHNVNSGDDIVSDNGDLLAAVKGNLVDLALDHHSGVDALVDVHRVLGLSVLDGQGLGVLLVLNSPLLTLKSKLGGLVRGGVLGVLPVLGGSGGGNNAGGTELGVLVGHLGLLNLLESRGDVSSLVQGREEVRLGSTGGGSSGSGGSSSWGGGSSSGLGSSWGRGGGGSGSLSSLFF